MRLGCKEASYAFPNMSTAYLSVSQSVLMSPQNLKPFFFSPQVDSARGAHRLSVDGLARAEARVEGLSASLEGLEHTHSEGEEEGCPTCGREWGDEAAREERRRVLKTELKTAKQAVTAGRKQQKLTAKALEGTYRAGRGGGDGWKEWGGRHQSEFRTNRN